jgi:hypothetical protein
VRALNYCLEPMDWINVKLKAGRIVPALATTTAAIAGLQTIELIKLLKLKVTGKDDPTLLRNTFLNLAVPFLTMSEPAPPPMQKLHSELKVSVWDRWEVTVKRASGTIGEIVSEVQSRFKLHARDILLGAVPVFFYALRDRNRDIYEQPDFLEPIAALLEEKTGCRPGDFVDLTITFVDPASNKTEDSVLENVPTVRVIFKD